jgi:hypothetical protein
MGKNSSVVAVQPASSDNLDVTVKFLVVPKLSGT